MALNRKIAIIDLTRRELEIFPVPEDWRRKFLGGRGMSTYLFCKYAPGKCGSLDPDNVFLISSGLLNGTLASPMGYAVLTCKSPLTGLMESAFLSGTLPAEMRRTGFDHLVIRGCARQPAILFIHDGTIEIIYAGSIWGKGIFESRDLIMDQTGGRQTQVMGIGIAGENRVRFASISAEGGAMTGRTGFGAVMGSKRLKAIACRGTGDIEIKNPEKVLAFESKLLTSTSQPLSASGQATAGPTQQKIFFENLSAADFGVVPETMQSMIQWAIELFRAGIINARNTGGIRLNDADPDTIMELVHQIVNRSYLGKTLGEGPLRAGKTFGNRALKLFPSFQKLVDMHTESPPAAALGQTGPQAMQGSPAKSVYSGVAGRVGWQKMADMIADSLGVRQRLNFLWDAGADNFTAIGKFIALYTGLTVGNEDLKDIAYRCYTLERLFYLRQQSGRNDGTGSDLYLDVSAEIAATMSLQEFQKKAGEYYKSNGWTRSALLKKGKVFEKLGIEDLWPKLKGDLT